MMEEADEVLLSEAAPLSHAEPDIQHLNHPESQMIFHCRPDLNGRRLLFQDRNSSSNGTETRQPAPVQLLTLDGRSHLGVSAASNISDSDVPLYPGQDDEKLARILVTTNPQTDLSSQKRIRQLQLTISVAAACNLLLTVMLLFPADTGAWYHVDAYLSPRGQENVDRVIAVRPALLVIAVLSNCFLLLASSFKMDALLTVYISAIAVLDIWSLLLLLPHALFLLRFLFDVLLIGVALELRTHLEHTWFLTSFHRLRA